MAQQTKLKVVDATISEPSYPIKKRFIQTLTSGMTDSMKYSANESDKVFTLLKDYYAVFEEIYALTDGKPNGLMYNTSNLISFAISFLASAPEIFQYFLLSQEHVHYKLLKDAVVSAHVMFKIDNEVVTALKKDNIEKDDNLVVSKQLPQEIKDFITKMIYDFVESNNPTDNHGYDNSVGYEIEHNGSLNVDKFIVDVSEFEIRVYDSNNHEHLYSYPLGYETVKVFIEFNHKKCSDKFAVNAEAANFCPFEEWDLVSVSSVVFSIVSSFNKYIEEMIFSFEKSMEKQVIENMYLDLSDKLSFYSHKNVIKSYYSECFMEFYCSYDETHKISQFGSESFDYSRISDELNENVDRSLKSMIHHDIKILEELQNPNKGQPKRSGRRTRRRSVTRDYSAQALAPELEKISNQRKQSSRNRQNSINQSIFSGSVNGSDMEDGHSQTTEQTEPARRRRRGRQEEQNNVESDDESLLKDTETTSLVNESESPRSNSVDDDDKIMKKAIEQSVITNEISIGLNKLKDLKLQQKDLDAITNNIKSESEKTSQKQRRRSSNERFVSVNVDVSKFEEDEEPIFTETQKNLMDFEDVSKSLNEDFNTSSSGVVTSSGKQSKDAKKNKKLTASASPTVPLDPETSKKNKKRAGR